MGLLVSLMFGLLAGAVANSVLPIEGRRGRLFPIFLGAIGAAFGFFVGIRVGFGSMYGFDARSIGVGIGVSLTVLMFYRLITDGTPTWQDWPRP